MRSAFLFATALLLAITGGQARAGDCDPSNVHLFAMIGCSGEWDRQIAEREQNLRHLDAEYTDLERQNADLKWRVREERRITDGLRADVARTTNVLHQLRTLEGNAQSLHNVLQQAQSQADLLEKDIALAQRVRDDLARRGANVDPDNTLAFDWGKLRQIIGRIRDVYGWVEGGYDAAKYFDLIGPETVEILDGLFGIAADIDVALGGFELFLGFL